MIPDKILSLSQIFSPYPAIEAVYLFGSFATGKANHRSDLDLGIVCKHGTISADQKLSLLAEITKRGFDRIDLLLLDGSDIFLAREVVKHHKLIFQREDFYHPSYFSKVIRQYLDFKLFLERQTKDLSLFKIKVS